MSKISDGYNALLARIEAVLDTAAQGYFRLPNPYKPEENNERYLVKGYGLTLGAATNTNRVVNCKYSLERTVSIVLTRQYAAREDDAAAKASAELALYEDQFLLIKDLEQDVTVNGSTMYTRYTTDSGTEYVSAGTDRFYMLRTDFALEYFENFQ